MEQHGMRIVLFQMRSYLDLVFPLLAYDDY
jgi:hypothetical protein